MFGLQKTKRENRPLKATQSNTESHDPTSTSYGKSALASMGFSDDDWKIEPKSPKLRPFRMGLGAENKTEEKVEKVEKQPIKLLDFDWVSPNLIVKLNNQTAVILDVNGKECAVKTVNGVVYGVKQDEMQHTVPEKGKVKIIFGEFKGQTGAVLEFGDQVIVQLDDEMDVQVFPHDSICGYVD